MIEYLDLLMFAAAILVLLLGFPVAFSLAGIAIIFALIGDYFGVFPIQFLKAIPQRIFGTMTNEVLMAVPLFIFMGTILEKSKVAEDLLENMKFDSIDFSKSKVPSFQPLLGMKHKNRKDTVEIILNQA